MILGLNDCHDAGSVLVENGKILSAANEERFAREKNYGGFPENSIKFILRKHFLNSASNSNQQDSIDHVAVGWIGGTAFMGRVFPRMLKKRQLTWSKKLQKPSKLGIYLRNLLFRLVQNQKPKFLWRSLGKTSSFLIKRRLSLVEQEFGRKVGLESKNIFFLEHHAAHAASAYYASGFDPCLVITMDGAGDGLC